MKLQNFLDEIFKDKVDPLNEFSADFMSLDKQQLQRNFELPIRNTFFCVYISRNNRFSINLNSVGNLDKHCLLTCEWSVILGVYCGIYPLILFISTFISAPPSRFGTSRSSLFFKIN